VAADELTKTLLLEEVAAPRAIAEALFASVNGGVPLLQALVDSGAASPEVLSRYLGRSEAPFLRHVVPVPELVEGLPRGLCERLLALPVRHDAITGTVDVVVADTADPHPANEIAFHLAAPVRVVRAPVAAIEEALRRLRMSSHEHASSLASPTDRFHEAARGAARADGEHRGAHTSRMPVDGTTNRRPLTLPPPVPELSHAIPFDRDVPPRRGGLVIETDSVPPPAYPPPSRMRTPPWGTPIHMIGEQRPRPGTEPPRSGYGSEIPIPLTRKTVHPGRMGGGTQRPPGLFPPAATGLGEGYAFDTTGIRDVVEKSAAPRIETAVPSAAGRSLPVQPVGSFIPGPPPLPGASAFAAYAPQLPFPEMGGILAALRNASSRDEVLELVLTGARMVALKVALFVVKKGGYLGWVGTPEFADRNALQTVLIPLDANSIFDRAVREDLYLGPIRYDEVHAPLLRVIRNPSRDVAVVPIRVLGKTAVIIVADELGDTMIGTRRLEELARAAGEAFARIVRMRR
jgi:Type II secretion system (T2SS), protein E, N-terminal domain